MTNATSESSGCPIHCTPGHYSTTPNPTTCRDCTSNTYSDVHLADSCSSCPAHSSSPSTSSTVTNCTCNAGYTGPDGGTCAACTTGQFKSASGPANCTDCAAGKYSASVAAVSESTCSRCNAGYTGPDGAACEACIAGTYKDVIGSASCSLCPEGKYSTFEAAISESTCSECPTHTYSPDGSSMLTNCTCNKGYTGSDGAACAACIAGTYKDVNGSASCSLCPGGKYSAETGEISESTCSDCPSHTFSGVGSIAQVDCTCNKGYTGPDGVACMACIAGTYKDVNGSSPCLLCSQGKYSTGTGEILESTCSQCPENTYSVPGSRLLTSCMCAMGYTGAGGIECTPCVAGSYKDKNGTAACTFCRENTFSPNAAQISESSCAPCPPHSASGLGSSSCGRRCDAGYTDTGAACNACKAGKFKDVVGSAPCQSCGAGQYSSGGAINCTSCPAYSSSPLESITMRNCTCNAGYTGPDGGECMACPKGKFKASVGPANCTACEAGKYLHISAASFRNVSGSQPCASCPRHTISTRGSVECECDPEHQGRNCMIRRRASPGPAERKFQVRLQLLVNTSHPLLYPNVQQRLSSEISDFFSLRSTESLTVGGLQPTENRRNLHLRSLTADVVISANWSDFSLHLLEQRADLVVFFGGCCQVTYMSLTCGQGYENVSHQSNDQRLGNDCSSCRRGYYKEAVDDSTCVACPQQHSTTALEGATNEAACECKPGYYMLNATQESTNSEQEFDSRFGTCVWGTLTEAQAAQTAAVVSAAVGAVIATAVGSAVGLIC